MISNSPIIPIPARLMVEEIVKSTLRTAVKKIHETEGLPPAEDDEKLALAKTVSLITSKIIQNMKPYDALLEKHLSIPDYVLQPGDKKHDVTKHKEATESDMLNLKIQSQMLETEVKETAKVIRTLEEELAQYEQIKQSFEDVEAAMDVVESRLNVDLKLTEQKKAIKNIEGLILDKKGF